MPTPRKGQTRQEFMNMCIPVVMKEDGHKDSKKAAGKCGGIYDNWKKKHGNSGYILDHEELKRIIEESLQDEYISSDVERLRELSTELSKTRLTDS